MTFVLRCVLRVLSVSTTSLFPPKKSKIRARRPILSGFYDPPSTKDRDPKRRRFSCDRRRLFAFSGVDLMYWCRLIGAQNYLFRNGLKSRDRPCRAFVADSRVPPEWRFCGGAEAPILGSFPTERRDSRRPVVLVRCLLLRFLRTSARKHTHQQS